MSAPIKHRKAAFTLINTYFSRIYAAVENERPYIKDEITEAAQLVETLSALPWLGFAPGSEYGATRAKDDIWLDEERFQELMVQQLWTNSAGLGLQPHPRRR